MTEKTFVEQLELYPNCLNHAFYLNGDTESVYFMIDEPEKVNSSAENGLECYVSCLKLILQDGKLLSTKLYLKKKDIKEPITYAKFHSMLKEGFNQIDLLPPTRYRNSQIIKYNQLGIK
jgi:hypothetical protein